jgi:hypothetical protein
LAIGDCGLSIADCVIGDLIADCRLAIADCGLSIADCAIGDLIGVCRLRDWRL